MKFEEKATCLTAISKSYDFNGNSGISHRIRLYVNGEIFVCKSTPEQVQEFQKYIGKVGTGIFVITSPKEAIAIAIESFKTEQ